MTVGGADAAEGPFAFRLKLPAGVEAWVYPSALVVAVVFSALVAYHHAHQPVALAIILLIGLVLSDLAHELAHLVVARRFGLACDTIVLSVDGAFVFLEEPKSRASTIAIAFAGPAANLLIAGVAFAIWGLSPLAPSQHLPGFVTPLPSSPTLAHEAAFFLGVFNLAFGLSNLAPAVPTDGGVILRAALPGRVSERAASLLVASLGLVFAVLSTVVLIASVLAMVPLYLPPSFGDNFREFRRAWRMAPGQAEPGL
ncbi:stage IV sporulation protein FB [Rhodopseudomonas julia]|uniref:Stage IV sporulation protein FB n=1 Tax=Rhodopseudomonas julia TaxID=200617 RepID=A0ABU0C261_9BRAD|nr:site-2 protease family protein [Rhodopseudomonas julia]MDQ0324589.1 stage IV sporulation protein FB [Rhodopseudomonas julia]